MTEPSPSLLARLAARLHDPPEKALVLMRTREGHEAGTTRDLAQDVFGKPLEALDERVQAACKRADRWASAADRTAFPNAEGERRFPAWQQVRFHERPVLVHPLTGAAFDLQTLGEVDAAEARSIATDHLQRLVQRNAGGTVNLQRTALAFWRFGPEINEPQLRNLWTLLPADTRVPDHTIWDHLDLTAALSGAFAADIEGGPALLAVSIGPVQDFIAAARSTSDLWAGSHLLARLSWEAMRVVCERCGPEAVLFPRLRGIPQVDLWLREVCGLDPRLFDGCAWTHSRSDANPLFAAALPNRFTALVPAAEVAPIVEEITRSVREFARGQAQAAWQVLLDAAGTADSREVGHGQIEEQLRGFPEVHWAAVPWSLAGSSAGDAAGSADASRLAAAMQPLFTGTPPGWLASEAWQLLSRGVQLDEGWFFRPNPGALYPALHELLERVLAATKGTRTFEPATQEGWRCALTGETEWICTDRSQLSLAPGQRQDTVWTRAALARPSWVKRGEHLGALPLMKRMWPVLFSREVAGRAGIDVQRYVVSTHSMALAAQLAARAASGAAIDADLAERLEAAEPAALPRRLARAVGEQSLLRRAPGLLERSTDDDKANTDDERTLRRLLGVERLETYYGLLMMDGDRMGQWLAPDPADPDAPTLPVEASLHPQVRAALHSRFGRDDAFLRYALSRRGANPARHMAISDALNQFALNVAPWVVEERHHGKLIYAGGDDVLALAPAAELMSMAAQLRSAYSGEADAAAGLPGDEYERKANGFVWLRGRLLRLMGQRASASCGLVIAHHQAPLTAVLRTLRRAEQRAKEAGRRDAWSLALVKRSGGTVELTAKFGEPLAAFERLRRFLADPGVSRRAAYNTMAWLADLPAGAESMLGPLLVHQMRRQSDQAAQAAFDLPALAHSLARITFDATLRPTDSKPLAWLRGFIVAAEFLARETRSGTTSGVAATTA